MTSFEEFMNKHKGSDARHRSFRLTHDETPGMDDPHHMILIAGSLLAIMISAQMLYSFTYDIGRKSGNAPVAVVLGESTSISAEENASIFENKEIGSDEYMDNVRLLLRDYFTNRATYLKELSSLESVNLEVMEKWKNETDYTIESLLEMKVPGVFKDLHLRLVTTLYSEKEMIFDFGNYGYGSDSDEVSRLTSMFEGIFKDYPWLND